MLPDALHLLQRSKSASVMCQATHKAGNKHEVWTINHSTSAVGMFSQALQVDLRGRTGRLLRW